MTPSFEINDDGNVILKPVTGWTTAVMGEVAVLLQMRYSDTPADIDTDGKAIQFALTAPQCLELGDLLTKQGERLLKGTPSPAKYPN